MVVWVQNLELKLTKCKASWVLRIILHYVYLSKTRVKDASFGECSEGTCIAYLCKTLFIQVSASLLDQCSYRLWISMCTYVFANRIDGSRLLYSIQWLFTRRAKMLTDFYVPRPSTLSISKKKFICCDKTHSNVICL